MIEVRGVLQSIHITELFMAEFREAAYELKDSSSKSASHVIVCIRAVLVCTIIKNFGCSSWEMWSAEDQGDWTADDAASLV